VLSTRRRCRDARIDPPVLRNDAQRWPEFVAFMDRAAAFLDAAYRTPMPRLPHVGLAKGWPLAKLAWTLRRLGGKDMFRVIRAMSMSAWSSPRSGSSRRS
jgi:hypothetical protein